MSQYFEYKLNVNSLVDTTRVLATSWSASEHPVLAAATNDGEIVFFTEEGVKIEVSHPALSRSPAMCNQLAWHPRLGLLATGWSDGTVLIWSETDKSIREDNKTHKSAITFITWSPEGSRLISGDEFGTLAMWDKDYSRKLKLTAKHDKKGPITHLCFRAPEQGSYNNHRLASCPAFFFGGGGGSVYFGGDYGGCADVVQALQPLLTMYYSHENDYLVLLTVDLTLYKFRISKEGKMRQDKKIKLSAKQDGRFMECSWIGGGLLAAANQENLIRLWDLENDSNYFLPLNNQKHGADSKDIINCLSFNPRKRILAGGCQSGRVVMWRYGGNSKRESSEHDWEIIPSIETIASTVSSGCTSLTFGPGDSVLAICSKSTLSILNETVLHCRSFKGTNIIQTSSDVMYAMHRDQNSRIETGLRIKGIAVSEKFVVVYNGKTVEVRDVTENKERLISSFNSKASSIAIHGDNLYCGIGSEYKIEIMNLKGIVMKDISFAEHEGGPEHVWITENFLGATTQEGLLKLWNIKRANPKTLVPGRVFYEAPENSHIKSIRINCDGTRISMIMHKSDSGVSVPCSEIFVYDVELDKLDYYDFGPHFYPIQHFWDETESKLFAVETHRFDTSQGDDNNNNNNNDNNNDSQDDNNDDDDQPNVELYTNTSKDPMVESEVTTLFATQEDGVLMQDSFPIKHASESLMGINVPFIMFMGRNIDNNDDNMGHEMKNRTMRDFIGMENVDKQTRDDLMSFSYYLTIGNMDEAYRAVKRISSEGVWENMAKMCVKNKRLDVAEVCFGNMSDARGCKAIREAKKEPDIESRVAMVAIQLGMLDDAERLYRDANRWDLLIKLYMASGRWNDALAICAKHDRIRLRTTHYLFAKHLESLGFIKQAMKQYEKSETHSKEIPRMLYEHDNIDRKSLSILEKYVLSHPNDKKLNKWWAQYHESIGDEEEAIKFYKISNDVLAEINILTIQGEFDKAEQLCKDTNDMAACYRMAGLYEANQQIEEAIRFYTLAKRHNQAVRLAKENGMERELLTLTLEAGGEMNQLEAAQYFEASQNYEKAILLYQKAGKINKALDLAFRAKLFDSLNAITDNLGDETNPALLTKCAKFFLQNQQYEKAVHMFASANDIKKAMEICEEYHCNISEELAEELTPPKTMEKSARQHILSTIAALCSDQGNFALACKKYTQAGDRIEAMKCLLRTNDKDKIIYYAAMTKKAPIFILAANYLQNLDWHSDPEIEKTIITFYSKAKAVIPLSMFYETCAVAEIDNFTDYRKALLALHAAEKALENAKTMTNDIEIKLQDIKHKVHIVEMFCQAEDTSGDDMLSICENLLNNIDVHSIVRAGDVYHKMIIHYVNSYMFQEAYDTTERMKNHDIMVSNYVSNEVLQQIYNAIGIVDEQDNDNMMMMDDDDDMEMELDN